MDANTHTAFVLDDDMEARNVIATWMSDLAFEVSCFSCYSDFEPALTAALAGRAPDLIVLDLDMPAVDGLAVIDRLAQRQVRVPIFILSSMNTDIIHAARTLANFQNLNVIASLNKSASFAKFAEMVALSFGNTVDSPEAIDADSIGFVYQPIARLESRAVVGVEALVRIADKPPTAAQIAALEWGVQRQELWGSAVERAFSHWRAWQRPQLQLSLNVSAGVLAAPDFYDDLTTKLRQHRMPANRLTLELTERAGVTNPMAVVQTMCRLRMLGVRFALDDFGSRFSTVERLRTLPFTDLKLDGKLLKAAEHEHQRRITAERAMNLARGLELSVTAESVETEQDMVRARTLGVDFAQGYGIFAPLTADEVPNCDTDRPITVISRQPRSG